MIVTFALAAMVLVLGRSMSVELQASANLAATVQASGVERAAEQYLLAMLTQEKQNVSSLGEEQFAGIPVGDGWFWVLRPDFDDPSLPTFGFVDESSKVNLNTASYEQLMMLPGMNEDVASAIMEWKDDDENIERSGPESEYYLSLPDPYFSKNDLFETVEETLLVRGVTNEMLYGTGPHPPLGSLSKTNIAMGTDPALARGLYEYLTVYSRERNRNANGERRINVTDTRQRNNLTNILKRELSEQRAAQIMGLIGNQPIVDVFDFYFKGKLTTDEFQKVEDFISGEGGRSASGRINVNSASRDVLLTLDTLDPSDVDKLIAGRKGQNSSASLAWVPDVLGQKAVGLGNRITARSFQYSADICAVSGNGRAFKRVRIVIDTRSGTPQIVYRRDNADRGWPMDRSVLASLRAGQGPGPATMFNPRNTLTTGGM